MSVWSKKEEKEMDMKQRWTKFGEKFEPWESLGWVEILYNLRRQETNDGSVWIICWYG